MPEPRKDETKEEWMNRCMGDEEQKKTFPDQEQRIAVCARKWDDRNKKKDEAMKELTIRMKADDVAEVLLYDEVGEDPFFGMGISAKTFREQIKAIKAKTINLRINSPGGSCMEGAAMLATLDDFPGKIEVDIDGYCASIASAIAMAGDTIRCSASGMFMIHDPMGCCMGGSEDMKSMAGVLDKVKETILDAYMRRAKPDRKQMAKLMTNETWFTAAEAIEAGLADSTTEPMRLAAHFDWSKFKYRNMPVAKGPTPEQMAETEKRKNRIKELMGKK